MHEIIMSISFVSLFFIVPYLIHRYDKWVKDWENEVFIKKIYAEQRDSCIKDFVNMVDSNEKFELADKVSSCNENLNVYHNSLDNYHKVYKN